MTSEQPSTPSAERSLALPPGYTLHSGVPPVPAYRNIRAMAGLSLVTEAQASRVASGTWHGCYITHSPTGDAVVAMGRIIGDGGWYFHIADMYVLISRWNKVFFSFLTPLPTLPTYTTPSSFLEWKAANKCDQTSRGTLPEHQRKGLGTVIMNHLLAYIKEHAPGDGVPYINLFADPPGRNLYKRSGFVESSALDELGMVYHKTAES